MVEAASEKATGVVEYLGSDPDPGVRWGQGSNKETE